MHTDSLDRDFQRFLRTRDPEAMAAVFDAAAPRLLLVAMHLCRDGAAAEDLVQTVFLHALRDADRFDAHKPVLPWLLGLLQHRAADLRDRAHHRRERSGDAAFEMAPARAPSPPREAIDAEVRQRLAEALVGMPRDYRDVLTLRLVHGLRAVDIAHANGLPPSTVRTRLRRGLELLRGALPRGLATPGMLALLGAELLRAQDGLRAVRANVLAAAGAGTSAALGVGFWSMLAACAALAAGAWQWSLREQASPVRMDAPAAAVATADPGAPSPDTSARQTPAPERTAVAAEPPADPRRSSLSGRVIDATSGSPLAGVAVSLRAIPEALRGDPVWDWRDPDPVHTDAQGRFEHSLLPPPTMSLELGFAAPSHLATWHSFPPLREGVQIALGDVAMQPGTPVRLSLLVGDMPLGGVRAMAAFSVDGAKPSSLRGYAASGRDGVLDLGICEPGTWFFELRTAFDGNEGRFEVPLQAQPLDVPIVLQQPPRERTISGVLVDTAGAPVPGVELAIAARTGGAYTEVTDLDGAFLWSAGRGTAPSFAEPRITLWGNQPELHLVDDGGDIAWGSHGLRLVVRRRAAATLRLEVVDADSGNPVEQFAATCWPDPWAPGARCDPMLKRAASLTRPGGVATFTVPAGASFVSVFPPAPWAERAEVPVALAEGESRTLRVELLPPAELVVDAVDASTGERLPGIDVALAKVVPASRRSAVAIGSYRIELALARRGYGYSSEENTIVMARAVTDASGTARLQAPPDLPGLVLFAEGPRCVATLRHDVELTRAGAATTIAVVPAGEVRGALGPRALLQRCGPTPEDLAEAAARAKTQLPDPDQFAEDYPRVELRRVGDDRAVFGAHTAPDGTFAIGALPAGRYEAWVELTARDAVEGHVWSAENGPLATIDVRPGTNPPLVIDAPQLVPSRAAVRFFVDGQPWHGPAGLRLVAPDREVVDVHTSTTGEARTPWLRPGTWLPFATVVDAHGERRPILGTDPILVGASRDVEAVAVLQRRRLELTVHDAAGAAATGRWLRIDCVGFPELSWRQFQRVDGAGRIVFDPAPPGRLALEVWPPGHGPGDGSDPVPLQGEIAATASSATVVLPR